MVNDIDMKCNCNDNGGALEKPKISHVYGNVLRIAIPLTLRSLIKDGDEMISTDTDFIPSSEYPVNVVFGRGKTRHAVSATMENNVAVIEDQGKIPIGTYDITVECRDSNGNPYRFKQNTVLQVVDTTAEAGIEETIEYEAQTWYLNAAVFLATTELGSVDDMIDQKLEYVFGFVEYDQSAKVFRFYNKNRTAILAEVDASPFISDGMVANVYIDTLHKTLVVVLNEDAGGRRFNVPLYLLFDNYYTKTQVDSRFSSVESQLSSRANINGSSREEFAATLFKLWGSEQSDGVAVIIDADVDHGPDSAFIAFIDNYNYGGRLTYVFPQDTETRYIATEDYVQDYVSQHGGSGGGSFTQVQSDWDQTDTSAVDYIKNKPTIPVIPNNVSYFTNDAGYLTQHQDISGKVDKVTGKGLSTNDYTTAEKNKLNALPANPVQTISVNGGSPQQPVNGNVDLAVSGGQGASGFTVNETSTALVLTVWDGATVNETSTSITIQQAS